MQIYVVYPVLNEQELHPQEYKNFTQKSIWCGEGYSTLKEARLKKKFLESQYQPLKFEILKESL